MSVVPLQGLALGVILEVVDLLFHRRHHSGVPHQIVVEAGGPALSGSDDQESGPAPASGKSRGIAAVWTFVVVVFGSCGLDHPAVFKIHQVRIAVILGRLGVRCISGGIAIAIAIAIGAVVVVAVAVVVVVVVVVVVAVVVVVVVVAVAVAVAVVAVAVVVVAVAVA